MDKRGVYFFVVDAIIAGAVLIAALLFIFSTHTAKPERDPTLRSSEDLLSYISTTKIREYQSSMVENMTVNGNITRIDNTLLDQMVEFYYKQKNTSLQALSSEVAARIISQDRGVLMYFNGNLVYNSSMHKPIGSMASSNLVITGKRMSFHRLNATSISSPVWVEVKVWV